MPVVYSLSILLKPVNTVLNYIFATSKPLLFLCKFYWNVFFKSTLFVDFSVFYFWGQCGRLFVRILCIYRL